LPCDRFNVPAAAEVLSEFAPSSQDKNGALYPVLEEVRTISCKVALAVGLEAQKAGLAPKTDVVTLEEKVSRKMWGRLERDGPGR
jgi:malate dehydrogenase (oxaloacetate-decarboxylating)